MAVTQKEPLARPAQSHSSDLGYVPLLARRLRVAGLAPIS